MGRAEYDWSDFEMEAKFDVPWARRAAAANRRIAELTAERDAARREAEGLKATLAEVEWIEIRGLSSKVCPWCVNLSEEGHKPHCRLATALAAPPPDRPATEAEADAVHQTCAYPGCTSPAIPLISMCLYHMNEERKGAESDA